MGGNRVSDLEVVFADPDGELREVELVSGQRIQVQGEAEHTWFEATRDSYLKDTSFTEATDLRDLDRLLMMELMVYRWTVQLAAGKDYDGLSVDEEQLRKNIKEYSAEITKTKQSMGMSKSARDAEANNGNFADYLSNLKMRARLFGIHRENQLNKAIALFHELKSLVETFDRADEEERTKLGFESEGDILTWVRDVAIPEFMLLDEHFRQQQRLWIREQ